MTTYFDIIMIPLQLLIVFFTIYYFTLSFFGLVYRKKDKKVYEEKHTFAMVVCAHNEERVIGALVENLHLLNYSDKLYDIFVVADNCTDKTAEVARAAGAQVHERFNDTEKGKGYAMDWMFNRIFKMERQYDAVCVFDSKNPNDTWISGTFSIAFWVINHVYHLAKYNIGLSSCLGGTGMCISTDILRRYGWGATCLTEDMEFTMKAILEGIPTTWAHDAIVYDEKPLTFMQSWNQRKRWAQGQFDVGSRYIGTLLKRGIKEHNPIMLDAILHLFQPYFLLLSTFYVICSYIYMYYPFYTNVLYSILPIEVWTLIGIGQYVFPVIVLWKIRASLKSWLYLLLYPLFIYSWIPITFLGFLHRHDHEWSHTLHTRSIKFDEVMIPKNAEFGPKQVVFPKK